MNEDDRNALNKTMEIMERAADAAIKRAVLDERDRCMSHIYAHFTPDQIEEHAETFRRIQDGDEIS